MEVTSTCEKEFLQHIIVPIFSSQVNSSVTIVITDTWICSVLKLKEEISIEKRMNVSAVLRIFTTSDS